MRIWECDMCKKRIQDGEVIPLMEFDLCSDCIDRVKKFIKDGLEPTIVPNDEKVKLPYVMPWEEVQMLKDKKVSRPSLNQISDAKPGACFHGEVWVTCPHCGEGHEMMGVKPEWTEDKFRVYRCTKCGEYFKDRIAY